LKPLRAGTASGMHRHRFISPLLAVALVPVGVALAASPEGTYRGRTSQGFKTVMKVKGGMVDRVNVPWRGHCRVKGFHWGPEKPFWWVNDPKGPIEQQGNTFSDSGRVVRKKNGHRAVITVHLKGKIAGNKVTGTESARVQVRDKYGHDVCKARVHWSATLVQG
jgi:hypothetical protein